MHILFHLQCSFLNKGATYESVFYFDSEVLKRSRAVWIIMYYVRIFLTRKGGQADFAHTRKALAGSTLSPACAKNLELHILHTELSKD